MTTQTYHVPSSIAGDAKSSDASVKTTVNELTAGIQLPSLQGGHIEGAGYTDTAGDLEYMFVIAQDNANDDFGAGPGWTWRRSSTGRAIRRWGRSPRRASMG